MYGRQGLGPKEHTLNYGLLNMMILGILGILLEKIKGLGMLRVLGLGGFGLSGIPKTLCGPPTPRTKFHR